MCVRGGVVVLCPSSKGSASLCVYYYPKPHQKEYHWPKEVQAYCLSAQYSASASSGSKESAATSS